MPSGAHLPTGQLIPAPLLLSGSHRRYTVCVVHRVHESALDVLQTLTDRRIRGFVLPIWPVLSTIQASVSYRSRYELAGVHITNW